MAISTQLCLSYSLLCRAGNTRGSATHFWLLHITQCCNDVYARPIDTVGIYLFAVDGVSAKGLYGPVGRQA